MSETVEEKINRLTVENDTLHKLLRRMPYTSQSVPMVLSTTCVAYGRKAIELPPLIDYN